MNTLVLELPEQFYEPAALHRHCGSLITPTQSGAMATIVATDDVAWDQLTQALRESLAKVLDRESC